MIVSNLKLNYTVWAFVLFKASNHETVKAKIELSVYILVVVGLLIFPAFIMLWMIKN